MEDMVRTHCETRKLEPTVEKLKEFVEVALILKIAVYTNYPAAPTRKEIEDSKKT